MRRQRTKDATIRYDDTKGVARIYRDYPSVAQKLLVDFLNQNKIQELRSVFLIYPSQPRLIEFIIGRDLENFIRPESAATKKKFTELLPAPTQKRQVGGLLVFCRKTRRFLMQIRRTEQDNPWLAGLWGSTVSQGETAPIAAARAAKDQGGFRVDHRKLLPLWVDENQDHVYHNYLHVVQEEFDPDLNLERVVDYIWVGFDGLQHIDLHPGARKLFQHDPILAKLREEIQKPKNENPPVDYRGIVEDIMN